jgi:pimeloyl-ACP methyl ester carboxylesterase
MGCTSCTLTGPEQIPIVLVHGTASSPARWAELVNEIEGDPRLRTRYQVWLFMYETGNPIGYSGGKLCQTLDRVIAELDPAGMSVALRQMIVIGHSQGGLLTKLTAIDSGDRFWRNLSETPLDALRLDGDTRELLRRSLFFTPQPFVKRVVFVATPHRGSFLAGWRIAHLASWLVTLPVDITRRTLDAMTSDEGARIVQLLQKPPTSIDNMSPRNPFVRTLSSLAVAPGISVNSIIAVNGDGRPENGDDGVVQYRSAYVDGAESTLVVRSTHSVQGNPATIEEIRRILLEHARVQ